MTVDEMVGWNHQLNGHEFEQTPGAGDGHMEPGKLQSTEFERARHDSIKWHTAPGGRNVQLS